MENRMKCGEDGFPLKYEENVCIGFDDNYSGFNSEVSMVQSNLFLRPPVFKERLC